MDPTNNEKPSLQLILDGKPVFESSGKWLYPLFELEDFLQDSPIDMPKAELHDKIIGKAAALLITRLEPGKVHGGVMSQRAMPVFDAAGIPYGYDQAVERILCKTEDLLADIDDIENAYSLLSRRAGRF